MYILEKLGVEMALKQIYNLRTNNFYDFDRFVPQLFRREAHMEPVSPSLGLALSPVLSWLEKRFLIQLYDDRDMGLDEDLLAQKSLLAGL